MSPFSLLAKNVIIAFKKKKERDLVVHDQNKDKENKPKMIIIASGEICCKTYIILAYI